MPSEVSICNIALDHIGKAQISALNEDSAEAQVCSRHYALARDSIFTKYNYRFLRGLQALAQLATNDRSNAWGYAYAVPSDVLRVRRVMPQIEGSALLTDAYPYGASGEMVEARIPYELEGGNLYCDIDGAVLEYTRSGVDAANYSQPVADAIACELAARVAYPLTRDRQLRVDALQLARAAKLEAEVWDARQSAHSSDIQSTIVISRN
jgi:hypothetical protein